MKRNPRNKNKDLLKIVLIGVGAYLLYKHFNKPKGTVTPGELQITAWDDVPVQTYNPELPQDYVDSPLQYYQVLRVNDDVLSGVKKTIGGGLPLTI